MNTYSSEELQTISSDFRAAARRLSRTDYSQCDANLKRFIALIDENSFISDFIKEKNIKQFDIPSILSKRDWRDPFDVSHVITEEISFEYQLLKYAVEKFDGDFTRLYGTHCYINAKSTTNDEMRTFIEHIIDPLIDHIAEHVRRAYDQANNAESRRKVDLPHVNATNSTILFNSKVGGDVSTFVNLKSETKESALEIIKEMVELLNYESINNTDEILEILESINNSLKENQEPKKGFLTALKTLCSGATSIAGLATALFKLFTT